MPGQTWRDTGHKALCPVSGRSYWPRRLCRAVFAGAYLENGELAHLLPPCLYALSAPILAYWREHTLTNGV